MEFEFELAYSEALLKRAVFDYWMRWVGSSTLILLPLAFVFGLLVYVYEYVDARLAGGLIGVSVICFAIAALGFWIQWSRTLRKFFALEGGKAFVRMKAQSLEFESPLGKSDFAWRVIREVWQFRDYFILIYGPGQMSTLPLAGISAEGQAFLVAKVREAGGKVR